MSEGAYSALCRSIKLAYDHRFAHRFIDPKLDRRMAQVGGFHIFHREDPRP